MIQVFIKAPIWNSNSVGVNKKIIKDDLLVEIIYKKEDGSRLYPQVFYMPKHRALQYPIQEVQGKVKLHVIPISDFLVLTEDEIDYARYCQMQGIPFRLLESRDSIPEPPKKEEKKEEEKLIEPKVDESVQQRMDWVNN
jgi:hypothetical protein